MAVYVMLTTLTDEGRKTIKDNPDRIVEVNKEVEEMGGKILAQYAILGQYDFINIIETVLSKKACLLRQSAKPCFVDFWYKLSVVINNFNSSFTKL